MVSYFKKIYIKRRSVFHFFFYWLLLEFLLFVLACFPISIANQGIDSVIAAYVLLLVSIAKLLLLVILLIFYKKIIPIRLSRYINDRTHNKILIFLSYWLIYEITANLVLLLCDVVTLSLYDDESSEAVSLLMLDAKRHYFILYVTIVLIYFFNKFRKR